MANIYLLNKPYQVLCQFTDDQGRTTLADFIDQPGVYAAGRLDYDSEGLLLLTDDGRLQQQITDPQFKLEKTYWVQVEGKITEAALEKLRKGVTLKDGPTRPAKAQIMAEPTVWQRVPPIRQRDSIPTSWLELKIKEGRNRQVRRMTANVGFPTLRLIRAAIGNWQLGSLAPGQWRTETVHLPEKKEPSRNRLNKSTSSRHRKQSPRGRKRKT